MIHLQLTFHQDIYRFNTKFYTEYEQEKEHFRDMETNSYCLPITVTQDESRICLPIKVTQNDTRI